MTEIINYMKDFRILLILDNMETVLDERISSFLSRLPNGSKVLITSRIGLGAFEVPVKLPPFTEEESIRLLRALAKFRNIETIKNMHSNLLGKYCNKMKNNPGYIKWFIAAIQSGKRPEEILANPDLFLEFCMSNVYSYLSPSSKKLLRSMLCLTNEMSQAELVYINEMEIIDVQKAVQELLKTSMVRMHSKPVGSSFETKYELAELARMYLQKSYPMKSDEYRKYKDRLNKLIAEKERYVQDIDYGEYSAYNISIRSTSDYIVAVKLRDAIERAKTKKYEIAEELIEEAKRLAPEYYEIRRIEAWIKTNQGNLSSADECYQAAIDLNTKNSALRYWYGLFLMNYLNNITAACEQFEKAMEFDKNSLDIKFQLARAYLYLEKFSEAKSLLEPLISSCDMSIFLKRKIWDIYLQVYYRKADSKVDSQTLEITLDQLEEFETTFNDCPSILYDDSILKLLGKLDVTILKIRKRINDGTSSAVISRLDEFATWKDSILYNSSVIEKVNDKNIIGYSTGSVFKRWPDRSYGFILTEEGLSIYFNPNSMMNKQDWFLTRIGRKVKFNLSEFRGKMVATDVSLI